MIKGYPTQEKDDRLKAQFATVEPVREKQYGMTVNASVFTYEVATDAAEANSTTSVINATGHAARVGDVINITSGTHQNKEVKVASVATNSITLAETLSSAIATGVTFQILRPKYAVVGSDGTLPFTMGNTRFSLDGTSTEVLKDTITPANSRPLPVELMATSGPINITAGDLNVSTSHANDSMKIGDGTEFLSITASNQAEVAVTAALPAGTNNIGDVDVATLPGTVQADIGAIKTAVEILDNAISGSEMQVDVVTQPALSNATDSVTAHQGGTWNINNIAGTVSLPTGAATEATLGDIKTSVQLLDNAISGSEMQVDVVTQPALSNATDSVTAHQGGTWNINNVSGTVSLPTGAATEATLGDIKTSVQLLDNAVSGNELQVDVITQPALSSGTDSVAAVQSGTWNINNVSGTVSLPTGAATESTLGDIKTSVQLLDNAISGSEMQVDVVTMPNVTLNYLDVVDFIDTTPILDTSNTNIPGSSSNPVEIVASLAANVKKVQFLDTTGAFIGLYTGAALSEVLQAVFGPGSDQTVEVSLTSGDRVSLKRLDSTTAVSTGIVAINFLG